MGVDGDGAALGGLAGSGDTAVHQASGAGNVVVVFSGNVVAPNHLGIFGMVDEGVAVVLHEVVDGIVAVYLFLADGILLVPFQQHLHGPGLNLALVGHGARLPAAVFGVVAGCHIEIGTSNVALVLVGRLKGLS